VVSLKINLIEDIDALVKETMTMKCFATFVISNKNGDEFLSTHEVAYIHGFVVKSLVQCAEMRPCCFALVNDDQITCNKLKNHHNSDDSLDEIITHTIHSNSILQKP